MWACLHDMSDKLLEWIHTVVCGVAEVVSCHDL